MRNLWDNLLYAIALGVSLWAIWHGEWTEATYFMIVMLGIEIRLNFRTLIQQTKRLL